MNELYAILLGLVQGIRVAADQQQDPDPLRLHTTLLTTLGSSIRIRPFHGDRFNRLRTSLFPERHPLPLQRSKTTRLPDRRNNSYRPRKRPIVLFDGQGSHNQSIQHQNTNDPCCTSSDNNPSKLY